MNIVILGTGQVGLTHAVVCAELGHSVVAFDSDNDKLAAFRSGNSEQIKSYVNEPGLVTRLRELRWTRLRFASSWTHLVEDADAVFICIPAGKQDTAARDYRSTACELAENLARRRKPRRCVVINKSAVPVGTARWLGGILHEHGLSDVGVASNPEFTRSGNVLEAARQPREVVIGADRSHVFNVLRKLYKRFVGDARIRYVEGSPEFAEAMASTASSMTDERSGLWLERMDAEAQSLPVDSNGPDCTASASPGLKRSAG